jgi:cytochrome b
VQSVTYHREKVYDPVLRALHAWNALAILMLMVTAWTSDLFDRGASVAALWQLHVYLGYALVFGLIARCSWGFLGPRHAQFSDMWHPAAWRRALTQRTFAIPQRFGHHVLASVAYLSVYALLILMALTGLGMGPFDGWLGDRIWLKETLEETHEFITNVLLGFVMLHIAALIWHETRDRIPVAQSMVTGYQYLRTYKDRHRE